MKTLEKLLPFAAFLTVLLGTFCASAEAGNRDSELWIEKSEDRIISRGGRLIVPEKYFVYRLNRRLLKDIFANSPLEFTEDARSRENIIELPTPEGGLERFRILESPVLSPAIAAQFPDWKTFQAYGIDDPTATARLGITLIGFHATVFSTRGTYQIDPYQRNDIDNYITYFKRDVPRTADFHCLFDEQLIKDDYPATYSFLPKPQFRPGPNRKEYRLAIKGTVEYAGLFGGQTGGFAAVTTTVNRLNGIFRRDLAVGLQLVSGPNFLCSASGTCPYTNEINTAQLNLNQTEIDRDLGAANYDVGHLFTTSNGGLAQFASICGAGKARGASGQPNPQGDPFDVDRVAHEIGHQIGANHTFNADANCGTGSLDARKEPGSGVTIMGNAGNCSSTANLQRNSIDNFLVQSQDEVFAFLFGGGATCGTLSGSNIEPTVSAPTSFSIPFNTPYALTATASDGNGDPLTYSWEHDTASGGLTSNYPGTTDDDDTNLGASRILMRPYPPSNSPTRTFPSLTYILNNANEPPVTYTGTSATGSICATGMTCATGEDLPSVARTISYRVSVRDGVGGNAVAATNVTFINTTTPFAITSQNTPVTYPGNSTQTVTWNVSGTTAAPIGTANVKISLSTDGGQTFPTTLVASTPNDGTEAILLPSLGRITDGRIKVEAVGNIFFDINNAPIIIAAVIRAPFDFDGDGKTDIGIFRPAPAEWWINRSSNGSTLATQFGNTSDKIVPADFTGDGKADIAFWRPSTGFWFILRSEDFSFFSFPFGTNGDVPAPADYDGDGKTDAAVFRPSSVTWYISRSSGGTTIQQFGAGGDLPVVADYDGDGKADIAIFRPNVAEWWIQRSSNNQVFATQFGAPTDKTVQGDYTGDGKADIAFWRPATGFWFILRSEDFSFYSFPFGTSGDVPAPGDYDGDGKFDAAVFRPSETNWFIQRSTAGILIQQFGIMGDQPIPNAFVR